MATVQVRDVPDEVAQIISEKARAADKSISAYLRDLMTADAKKELTKRALVRWDSELQELQARLGLPSVSDADEATDVPPDDAADQASVDVIREIREEYEQGREKT